MRDHPEEGTTLMKDHPNELMQNHWETTLMSNHFNEGTTLMKGWPPWWTYWTCTFIRHQIKVSICRFIVSSHHCWAQRTVLYYITSPLPSTEDSSVLHHITTAEHRGQFCITSHHHCRAQRTVLYYITSPLPRADGSSVLHHITTAKGRWQFCITSHYHCQGWQFCITSHHHCQGQMAVLYYITSPLPRADGSSVLHHITTAKGRWQFCITSNHHCQGQMAVLYYITSPLPRVDDSSVLHHITTAKGRWQFCITSHHHCQGQRTVLYYITSPLPRAEDSSVLHHITTAKGRWQFPVAWSESWRQEETKERMAGFRTQRTLDNIFWWVRNRQYIEWLACKHGHWNVG